METKRQRLEILRTQLEMERASFIPHWRMLADYYMPRRPRFTINDVNKGDRRYNNIVDGTGTLSARTLRSGMMGGVTSPARPWFRLTTPDPDLAEFGQVKFWLHTVSQRMSTAFLRSNLYNVLPIIYGDIGVFGTSAMLIEEDFEDIIRCYPLPIGSYMLATDSRLKVNVFFREFSMTVRQVIQHFAERDGNGKIIWDNISDHVRHLYERGQLEAWVQVCHCIQPNLDYNPNKLNAKYKRYASCYYEKGVSSQSSGGYFRGSDDEKYLRESGMDSFRILAPRWEVTGEDVYGTSCPGMEALGDVKQLQLQEKRITQAIDKMVNPPMVGPTSLRNQRASILPGDITYQDIRDGQQGFRPAHEVNFRIAELENKQAQIRERVEEFFYANLFLQLSNSNRRQITAREIEERHEEKLLALGPVLEQLNQDLLDPLIDTTFEIMVKQGHIPEPPEELSGVKLKVEYISIMAQAQKLVGIGGVERFAGFVGQVATTTQDPSVLDKINVDQMIDVYADMTSIPPAIVRTDEQVEEIRQGRAQAQQAQQQAAMLQQGAGALKDLSQTNMEGDNALTRLADYAQAGQIVPAQLGAA